MHRSRARNPANSSGERLQKVLAGAGLGSRRRCEELIRDGRVQVDGAVVTALGMRVDPNLARIHVDGELVRTRSKLCFAVHKPRGVLSTSFDPSGRMRVIDLVPSQERLFTVGRLDKSSEGLILVTNDGDLAQRLSHPRFGVRKTYQVQVAGVPAPESLDALRKGMRLAEGIARVAQVKLKSAHKQSAILEVVLQEGKNREVRRLFAMLGHKVMRLRRVAIGPLRLGDLPPGSYRRLSMREMDVLRGEVSGTRAKRKDNGRPAGHPPSRRVNATHAARRARKGRHA